MIFDYNNFKNSNWCSFEDLVNYKEDNIVDLISKSITLDSQIDFMSYYKSIYLSTFKSYEEFIKHYIENTLFIYVLQNNKVNIYKALLKEYFKNNSSLEFRKFSFNILWN